MGPIIIGLAVALCCLFLLYQLFTGELGEDSEQTEWWAR